MQDIVAKNNTVRRAVASAVISVSDPRTIEAIKNKQVPKGDVFEVARTAGLFGVKRTSDLIPDCHPLPIEHTEVRFAINALSIAIEVEVKTLYKTGVEVEAMHGASVVALTMYDMLKPIDPSIEITCIRLLTKSGGKKDYRELSSFPLINGAVLVISDSVANGTFKDRSGEILERELKKYLNTVHTSVVSDDQESIVSAIQSIISDGADFVVTTGGTGLGPRDVTPEALNSIFEKTVPGIVESFRTYGQQRTPLAMLSRSVAGVYRGALIIALPGSPSAVIDAIATLFPSVLHYFQIRGGQKHADKV